MYLPISDFQIHQRLLIHVYSSTSDEAKKWKAIDCGAVSIYERIKKSGVDNPFWLSGI